MERIELNGFHLIGIALPHKTTNNNGQSNIDCGNLWQQFETGNYIERIPHKLSNDIIAVYHNYEGNHTKPFSYFIGVKVKPGTVVPNNMDGLILPRNRYAKFTAKGILPNCVADTWRAIWHSNILRAYHADFEVYAESSKNWNNAEVTIFISVQ